MTLFQATKPANIALIKYMGKIDKNSNIPSNASLSYTLNELQTTVTLEPHTGKKDCWQPLTDPKLPMQNTGTFIFCGNTQPNTPPPAFNLSHDAQTRFLSHLNRLKKQFNYHGNFIVRSANNFPANCGLASSASSFAALTQCAIEAISTLSEKPIPDKSTVVALSQQGSGSSCRSFFSPWALWTQDGVQAIDLPYTQLHHAVVILSQADKAVPSSEAHQRVQTSPQFTERPKRAEMRLNALIKALKQEDWQKSMTITWDEFEDMHDLFATAAHPFAYKEDKLPMLLDYLKKYWDNTGDGPLVTMDAGPNIHLLFRRDQLPLLEKLQKTLPTL